MSNVSTGRISNVCKCLSVSRSVSFRQSSAQMFVGSNQSVQFYLSKVLDIEQEVFTNWEVGGLIPSAR